MPTVSTLVVEVQAKTSKFSAGTKTAIAGLGALAVAGAYAFNQFEESNKVAQQTNAVLTSTGGAANVTADQVSGLATALSDKSGVDDEVIQSGENMLLTFKNIRNEVGAGNDIFNQASSATLDMAAGMAAASGGAVDMKSASIQLGKALNDPVAGISALSRVGVQFTAQQQKQIASMVAAGNTLGAQKIILQEVNSEFAGSAAAGKTSTAAMSVAVGNLAESIGGVLAPAINLVVNALTAFIGFLTRYPALFVALGVAVAAVATTMIVMNIQTAIAAGEGIIFTTMLVAQTAAMLAASAAAGIATAAQWAWNVAMSANPIGLVIIAIAAVVAVIILLAHHFHGLADVVSGVWRTIKNAIVTAWHAIFKVLSFTPLLALFRVGWTAVKTMFQVEWKVISAVVKAAWAIISGIVRVNVAIIKAVILPALNFISDHWRTIWNGMKTVFSSVWHALGAIARPVLNGIITLLNGVIEGINIVIKGYNLIPAHDDIGTIPPIPTLQTGGMVERTGLAIVHEGERFSGVGGSGGFGDTVNVYVTGSVIAEHDLAETVQKALLRSKRRSGALGLA